MKPNDLKDELGYVCKTKKGYVSDLKSRVGQDVVSQFESIGFITKGHTLKSETWRKTKLADQYYIDLYGRWSYFFL